MVVSLGNVAVIVPPVGMAVVMFDEQMNCELLLPKARSTSPGVRPGRVAARLGAGSSALGHRDDDRVADRHATGSGTVMMLSVVAVQTPALGGRHTPGMPEFEPSFAAVPRLRTQMPASVKLLPASRSPFWSKRPRAYSPTWPLPSVSP